MKGQRFLIKDGCVAGFADELKLPLSNVVKQRVSTIEPRAWTLRLAFNLIRACVSDDSRSAAWTRSWQCEWDVFIDGSRYGPYKDRQEAIAFEKTFIHDSGKVAAFLKQESVK